MSKYTTEVRFICETAAGYDESQGYSAVDEIIEKAIPSIFSFSFPIFDEDYRNVICTKILMHYYTREIGMETVALWKLKLQTKLNEIMPYYNQLYKSGLIEFNPLYDVDLHTTHVGDKNTESNSERNKVENINENADKSGSQNNYQNVTTVESGNQTGSESGSEGGNDNKNKFNNVGYSDTEGKTNYDLYSDTPQGALTGVDDEEYLTNARKVTDSISKTGNRNEGDFENNEYSKNNSRSIENQNESNSVVNANDSNEFNESANNSRTGIENSTGTDKINSTETYALHVVGKQAGVSYSKLLKEFRDTFLNIDMQILDELSPLFMNLW